MGELGVAELLAHFGIGVRVGVVGVDVLGKLLQLSQALRSSPPTHRDELTTYDGMASGAGASKRKKKEGRHKGMS